MIKNQKAIIFFSAIIALTLNTSTAFCACEGGTIFTAANGDIYCQSNKTMNWWSAYTWCKANGMHQPTIYEMCPDWNGNTGAGCSNMNGSTSGWSATVKSSNQAYRVTGGGVNPNKRNFSTGQYTQIYAICKQ